jgi:xanthine dehydrogenase YagR molybdenum-binding subunit
MNQHARNVGRAVSRVEGPKKVTGAADYAAEHFEPGMLHCYVVPSTISSGTISAIDVAEASVLPGVVKIYTHENRPDAAWWDSKWRDETAPPGHPFRSLHSERILFDGQPVALVVADTFENARDAASLITVTYVETEHQTDLSKLLQESYVPPKKRSGISPPPAPRGGPEQAYEAAAFKVSADYVMQSEHHNPMEMFATTVLWENEKQLTIYDKTQGSQNSRNYICGVFGLKPDDVRVMNPFVGGAFGAALRPRPQLFLAVMASLDLKRSVKLELSRSDMFYLSYRPMVHQTVSLAADIDGRLQSVLHHAVASTSMFEDYQEVVVNWSGLAYHCDNAKLTYELVKLNTDTPGDMRAPGAASGLVALESAMDELAYEVGIDPLELRKRNFTHLDQNQNKHLTSKALHACYREGAERFGWSKRTATPRSMRDGHELIGWGMATGFWEAFMTSAEAKLRLSANGELSVSAAASDIGTGTYTILAQIAGDAFDLPADQVRVEIGDSTLTTTSVQGGSWTAASSGSAVQAAAEAVKSKLLSAAQKLSNSGLEDAKPEETVIRGGRLVLAVDDNKGLALSEIFAHEGISSIEETGSVSPNLLQMMKYASYTHSAVFVEVRVDEDLGTVRVSRIVSAIAAGKILNPKTARSQILGGVVMGLGMALHEEGQFDHRSGRLMNHSLAEYHIPAHADVEDIDVIFVDETDEKVSAIGVKGLGEIGIVAVPAAIANAIFHATGGRQRQFPITIDKIVNTFQ